jgi:hypothetical protein
LKEHVEQVVSLARSFRSCCWGYSIRSATLMSGSDGRRKESRFVVEIVLNLQTSQLSLLLVFGFVKLSKDGDELGTVAIEKVPVSECRVCAHVLERGDRRVLGEEREEVVGKNALETIRGVAVICIKRVLAPSIQVHATGVGVLIAARRLNSEPVLVLDPFHAQRDPVCSSLASRSSIKRTSYKEDKTRRR